MKKKKIHLSIDAEKLLTTIISVVIPAIINFVVCYSSGIYKKDYSTYIMVLSALLCAIVTFFLVLLLPNFISNWKCFRTFSKYEGQWLQIIPRKNNRPYSILNLKYDKKYKRYTIHGANFSDNFQEVVNFDSYQVVERFFNDGFYYITSHTLENSNGLGKVCFLMNNYDCLTRAEGYFFDANDDACSVKYDFILVKCDDRLFEHINKGKNYLDVKKMPPLKILEECKEFAENERNSYYNKQSQSQKVPQCKQPKNQAN